MIASRFRFFTPSFLTLIAAGVLHADITLRYKTEIQLNPTLPAALIQQVMGRMEIPPESVTRLKGDKGISSHAGYTSLVDFTAKTITLLETSSKRYSSF